MGLGMRVPVVRSIEDGYGFLLREPLTILGLSWLPAAFYAAACGFWLRRMATAMLISVRPAHGTLNDFAFFDFLGLLLTTAFFGAALAAPLTREALGSGDERALAYFVFGRREARLFLALLRFFALLLAVLFALTMVCGIAVTTALPHLPANWQGVSMAVLLNAAVGLVLAASFLFLAIRFGFFLAPEAASDHPTGLWPAWSASRGNSWRLLVVYLAVAAPLSILLLALESIAWGMPLSALVATLWPGTHDAVARYQYLYDHAGSFAVVAGVALVLFSALFAGASATAYQGVAQDAEVEEDAASVESVWTPHPAFAEYRARPMARFEPPPAPDLADTAAVAASANIAQTSAPVEPPLGPDRAIAHDPAQAPAIPVANAGVVEAKEPVNAAPAAEIASSPATIEPAPLAAAAAPSVEPAPETPASAAPAQPAAGSSPAAFEAPPPDPGAFAATAANSHETADAQA